jgi:hypothetical protein
VGPTSGIETLLRHQADLSTFLVHLTRGAEALPLLASPS